MRFACCSCHVLVKGRGTRLAWRPSALSLLLTSGGIHREAIWALSVLCGGVVTMLHLATRCAAAGTLCPLCPFCSVFSSKALFMLFQTPRMLAQFLHLLGTPPSWLDAPSRVSAGASPSFSFAPSCWGAASFMSLFSWVLALWRRKSHSAQFTQSVRDSAGPSPCRLGNSPASEPPSLGPRLWSVCLRGSVLGVSGRCGAQAARRWRSVWNHVRHRQAAAHVPARGGGAPVSVCPPAAGSPPEDPDFCLVGDLWCTLTFRVIDLCFFLSTCLLWV